MSRGKSAKKNKSDKAEGNKPWVKPGLLINLSAEINVYGKILNTTESRPIPGPPATWGPS